MKEIAEQTLASIVTGNDRAVPVLEKYNLDFCCNGKRTLAQACTEKGIKIESITAELASLTRVITKQKMPFAEMDAEQLIEYILIHHHSYVKQSMPAIITHLSKVAIKHGDRFPYMKDVYDMFVVVAREMTLHMQNEEEVLFPRIREAPLLSRSGGSSELVPSSIQACANALEAEHEEVGAIMYQIRIATNNYTPPQEACTTFRLCLAELKEFEEDLHKHVHIENNILFPMAIKYESAK